MEGPARMFILSAQRRDHDWRIAMGERRNSSQTVHQPLEHTLFLVVIAVATPVRPAWRQILAATNRKRSREVASVVCRSWVASVCGSRLNSTSQQFRL